jgi:hypothetical protein
MTQIARNVTDVEDGFLRGTRDPSETMAVPHRLIVRIKPA